MMTSAEIRQQFLDFFKSKGHIIVPSAPIVVKNDPTLLFTNAGMNQFKDYFLGNKPAPYNRAADTQKCLRVSGKHNDLEEVGVDTYHHTMFEMLGNWSFGDYFKKDAIAWSWELLTDVYKLDKDRLYVTIFEGDAKENLPKDEEAYNEWKKVIAADRILLGNKKDNFWEMGDTGPCGPCSEIHVDCRSDEERKAVAGSTLVNNDHPQVIEIWNNVFMQFNRKKDGSLEPLPAQHVDTGMGFERLARVIQGKQSNYDTDIFTGTIAATEKISNKKYTKDDTKEAVAFRVIADHIRAISFTIADGQLPSNTGAGYVIRRILRRAVRYYYSYLDYKQPLLHQLLPIIAKQFESVFPELMQQLDFVGKVVKEEEDAFLRTLDSGLKRIGLEMESRIRMFNINLLNSLGFTYDSQHDSIIKAIGAASFNSVPLDLNKKAIEKLTYNEDPEITKSNLESFKNASLGNKRELVISGITAFVLYDTFGFPIDLTRLIASENNLSVDEAEFDNQMQKQKDRSRSAAVLETEDWITVNDIPSSKFVGYDSLETKSKVVKYRKVSGKGKELFQIVLDTTPFYAESGGQVGDSGTLTIHGSPLTIIDTKKENDLIIHFAETIPADLSGEVVAKVDAVRRKEITVHHSVTHLMHAALRSILGSHVAQKGSLNNEEHLRFDFSHFAKVTDAELAAVEKLVNEKIKQNIPVVIKEMKKDDAVALGAMALFGEKYGDVVRVVIMDENYSIELCGGTHVGYTGELGLFKIKSESAVAAGVRRIEAVCGAAAEELVNDQSVLISAIREQLKSPKEIIKSIENLQTENASLKKHIEALEARQLVIIRNELLQKDEIINNVTFIGDIVEVSSADNLKKLCFDLKSKLNDYVAVLCCNIDGKPFVAVGISDTVVAAKNLDAGKIIKEHIAPLIKGGGGGQKNLATAGGQDVSGLKAVIEKVKSLL
ncbi:alanine--tRNA ligase [Ferruginibacter sp.]